MIKPSPSKLIIYPAQRPITQALNPPPIDDPEGEDDITEVKPKILLFGLRRSGKTSIRKVVFHKMSANETIFLESTTKVYR